MDIIRIKLESDIIKKVHADNGSTVHFEWEEVGNDLGYKLNLYTFNPVHNQTFLCHSVQERTKLGCLEEMHHYMTTHEDMGEQSWTVIWREKGSNEQITSYFRGKNERVVLDKFYHGKDEDTIVLSELKLNPIS